MDIVSVVVQLVSGVVGGNIGGMLLKRYSLGMAFNSVAGLTGGVLGGQLLGMPTSGGEAAAATGVSAILSNIASSGVGGLVVMLVVALLKAMVGKPS